MIDLGLTLTSLVVPLIKVTFRRIAINFTSPSRSSCGHIDRSLDDVLLATLPDPVRRSFPDDGTLLILYLINWYNGGSAIDLLAVMKSNHDHHRDRPTKQESILSCCADLLWTEEETTQDFPFLYHS